MATRCEGDGKADRAEAEIDAGRPGPAGARTASGTSRARSHSRAALRSSHRPAGRPARPGAAAASRPAGPWQSDESEDDRRVRSRTSPSRPPAMARSGWRLTPDERGQLPQDHAGGNQQRHRSSRQHEEHRYEHQLGRGRSRCRRRTRSSRSRHRGPRTAAARRRNGDPRWGERTASGTAASEEGDGDDASAQSSRRASGSPSRGRTRDSAGARIVHGRTRRLPDHVVVVIRLTNIGRARQDLSPCEACSQWLRRSSSTPDRAKSAVTGGR